MSSDRSKIKYGAIDLDDSYLDPKSHKVRITTFVDGDILLWLKDEAKKSGKGYQTLLNDTLRGAMEGGSVVERIETLERKIGLIDVSRPLSRRRNEPKQLFPKKRAAREASGR
jgi:hypothetical protein